MNIVYKALNEIVPYANNPRRNDDAVDGVMASIKEFGFKVPIIIDKDGTIIAGHTRYKASLKLGLDEVPCIVADDLTEGQVRAFRIADNKVAESAEWDSELLMQELKLLDETGYNIELTGFSIDDIIQEEGIEETVDLPTETIDTETVEHRTKYGELWQLGDHRLLVGDSTNAEDVQRLVNGASIDLLETDPPYGVSFTTWAGETIPFDDLRGDEFSTFLTKCFTNAYSVLKEGGSFYIWHADANGLLFRRICEEVGLHIRQVLIWVKNRFTFARSDYQWRHEPCLYGWKAGSHYFIDRRNLSTVIESDDDLWNKSTEELVGIIRDIKEEYGTVMNAERPIVADLHPTVKPLQLIERHIRYSSREGENVLDLFGGSGTTLIACEKLKRKAYIMEYEPKYADVILERWESITGKQGERIDV